MDIGLVCDGCSAFNDISSQVCESCSCALSLGPNKAETQKVAAVENASSNPDDQVEEGNQDVICASCGATVLSGNRFCGGCGSPVDEAPEAPAPLPPPPDPNVGKGKQTLFFSTMQAAKAKLVLIKGEGYDGESYALAGVNHLVGSDDADIVFDEDPFLSSTHANFFYVNGKLMVEDKDSVNGVYIRIHGTRPIGDKEFFLVGEQVMQVSLLGPPVAPKPQRDGTYFYSSPDHNAGFELRQLMEGGAEGLCFPAVGDVVTLGREENDINFPDDPFISGHHAHVSAKDGALSLSDLGSKNGTFVRISQATPLEHGAYVFMGQQLLRVEIV